jgi:hypothetical protein
MNIKHLIFIIMLTIMPAMAFAASAQPADSPGARDKPAATAQPASLVGSVPLQDRGPSVSSPQEAMHSNGDRISHYPPYYRPESSGGPH